MIALFVTFFSAVILLFAGLNKKESAFSLFAVVSLFVSAALSFACANQMVSFGMLESWVPANMMSFGKEQHLFAALLAFITGFVILMFRENENLGTDQLGRDVLARSVSGARVAVLVLVMAVAPALVLGLLAGGLASMAGGRFSRPVNMLLDTILSVPTILLCMVATRDIEDGEELKRR